MGCIHFSTSSPCEQDTVIQSGEEKIYSWSNRTCIPESEYLIENLDGDKVFRSSSSSCESDIPLIISNCSNCVIGCFNSHSTITVNNCFKCSFYLGPTSGSISVHECTDCEMICATMQFRTRDCHNMFISLLCATQPSIESSSSLEFCPFNFYYPKLEEQLRKTELSIFNNIWYQIFDFNASEPGEKNWTLVDIKDFRSMMEMRFRSLTSFPTFQNSLEERYSHLFQVPIIEGHLRSSQHSSSVVLFFLPEYNREVGIEGQENEWKKVLQFVNSIQKREEAYLIKTMQVTRKISTGLIFESFGIKTPKSWEELVVIHIGSSNDIQKNISSVLQSISLFPIPEFVHVTSSSETTRRLHNEIFSK